MSNPFAEFIRANASGFEKLKPLPLVHNASTNDVIDILRDGQLNAAFDEGFQQELCFAFYGRPDYVRDPTTVEPSWVHQPASILFRPEVWDASVCHQHPFDTGICRTGDAQPDGGLSQHGIKTGRNYLETIGTFALPPGATSAQQLIQFFYKTNRAYVDPKALKPKIELPTAHPKEAATYKLLLEAMTATELDRRTTAIEVAKVKSHVISQGDVLAVFVPSGNAQKEPTLKEKEKSLGFKVKSYKAGNGESCKEHLKSLREAVIQFFQREGLFS